jgi:GWxTD domain-containing protein
VRGFASVPVVSDVVVSGRMRVLAAGEAPTSVEMQRGRFAIERAARVAVQPTDPKLWYYLELYRQGADSVAALEFRISPVGRDTALVRVTRNVAVGARGTVDAAALVVQGLPPGDYRLHVTARSGDREEARDAWFSMASFETAAPVAVATPGSEAGIYERYFAPGVATDAQINLLAEAMLVATPGETVNSTVMPADADSRRRFMARYWSRLPDPNPGTPRHELIDEYRQRVEHANRQYAESGRSGRSGVRTDRGRIYLKYGPPDATQLVQITGGTKTVDVWKYARNRGLKYAFLDESGFSNYNLIYTTDPQERTVPDWLEKVFDREAVRQILTF